MSDEKQQETESEATASASPNEAQDAKTSEPKREWKPTPKFDYSKVVRKPASKPKEPEPDILVVTSNEDPPDFPYGIAAIMAFVLMLAVYMSASSGHGGHDGGHGEAVEHDAAESHGMHEAAMPAAGVAHGAAGKAEVRKANVPQPRPDTRTVEKADPKKLVPPPEAKPAAEPAAEPEPEPEPEPAAEPEAKPAAEPKAKPAAGGLAAAQAEYDARHWFGAYRAAKDVYAKDKSNEALKLMGLAACHTKKASKLKYVFKRIGDADGDEVRKECESIGVKVP